MIAICGLALLVQTNSGLTVGDKWTALVCQSLVPDVLGDQPEVLNFRQTAVVVKSGEIKQSRLLMSTFIGSQQLPIPTDNTALEWLEQWSPNSCAERKEVADDAGQLRLNRVVQLPYFTDHQPIHQSLPMIGNAKAPAAEATWKLLRERSKFLERDVTKAAFSYKEVNGVVASGTALIDDRTGLPLQVRIEARNAPAPGGNGEPNIFKYQYDVTELKIKND